MMAYERSESAWDNFGEFIYTFRLKTKTLVRKIENIWSLLNENDFMKKWNLGLGDRVTWFLFFF